MISNKLILICIFSLAVNFCVQGQDGCEAYTSQMLQTLPGLLEKNDFAALHPLNSKLESHCGESELNLRLQIIERLTQKETTTSQIQRYLDQGYDAKLVDRHDYAAQKNFSSLYLKNKAAFDFIPLRHAVDSLTKVKATALLNSSTYTLNRQEEAICLLFADEIDLFYQTLNKKPKSRPLVDKIQEREEGKHKTSGVLYSGVFAPINENEHLKTSPTFGFMIMSPLYRDFIFELGLKLRVNTKNASFDFIDEGQIKEINSSSSYFLGFNIGYKVYDHVPWIILPKLGTGLGFINTKLAKTSVYDVVTDEGEHMSGIRYNNVNTLHSVAGLAVMRHIKRKMYLGIETSYHLVPYNWDESLISRMNSKFASVELFLRF